MIVGTLIVKLTPSEIAATVGAVVAVSVVLQVTPRRVLAAAVEVILILLLVCAAAVLTVQVPALALVAQEKAPAGAAAQATMLGFAAEPTAEQFWFV